MLGAMLAVRLGVRGGLLGIMLKLGVLGWKLCGELCWEFEIVCWELYWG